MNLSMDKPMVLEKHRLKVSREYFPFSVRSVIVSQ